MDIKNNPYANRGRIRAGAFLSSKEGQPEILAAKARIEAKKKKSTS